MEKQGFVRVAFKLVTTFVIILSMTGSSEAGCSFPSHLQTNSTGRKWRGRIKNQNTEVTYKITIHDNILRFISTDDSATSYSRICIRSYGDKFLVAHEQKDQDDPRFSCMQFVIRGDNVFQVREANRTSSMNRQVCDDTRLKLDPWPVIDMAHIGNEDVTCPLKGGFSTTIFDKRIRGGVCDGFRGQTRIESECVEGEGIFFDFGTARCTPDSLYMYPKQVTFCLAHWQEGGYTYSLLRSDIGIKYMWILRYSTQMLDRNSMVLLDDIVADETGNVEETYRFYRFDATRDRQGEHWLCVDDSERCETVGRNGCEDESMALNCPVTCGICDVSHPQDCSFPQGYHGNWHHVSADNQSIVAKLNSTSLALNSDQNNADFKCVDWNQANQRNVNAKPHSTTQMVVQQFRSGCRARYSCVEFYQNDPTLLLLKLSQSYTWPFTSSLQDPLDCSHFTFETDDSITPHPFRTRYLNVFHSGASNRVPCNLPLSKAEYIVTYEGSAQCLASLEQNETGDAFSVELKNCSISSNLLEGDFMCIDSTDTLSKRDKVIITQTTSESDNILCWVLPKHSHNEMYLVKSSDCNEAIHKKIERNRLSPLAQLTLTSDFNDHVVIPNEGRTVPNYPSVSPDISKPTRRYDADRGKISAPLDIDLPSTKGVSENSTFIVDEGGDIESEHGGLDTKAKITSIFAISVVVCVAVVKSVCSCKT